MKKEENIKQDMRAEFVKLWHKKSVHKNKKKYNRKPKHKSNGQSNN